MSTFSEAFEVIAEQLKAQRDQKSADILRAKANVDKLIEKTATGDADYRAVFDEQENLKQLEIDLRAIQILLEREEKRASNPEYMADLAAADESLKRCDEEAFHRRYVSEIEPELIVICSQLGELFARMHHLAEECREPFLQTKRLQARLGNVRVLPDEAGLYPLPEAIEANFYASFVRAVPNSAGEYAQSFACIFDRR
jgi:hypothetical protein